MSQDKNNDNIKLWGLKEIVLFIAKAIDLRSKVQSIVITDNNADGDTSNIRPKDKDNKKIKQQYSNNMLVRFEHGISPRWSICRHQRKRKNYRSYYHYELRSYHEIKTRMYIVGEACGLSSYTMTCNERHKFSVRFLYSFATYSYSDPGNKDLFFCRTLEWSYIVEL